MDSQSKQYEKKRTRKFFCGANWKCNGSQAFVRDIISNLINDLAYDPSQVGKHIRLLNTQI